MRKKKYGKTKAEREYVDRRGPKRFLFDGPNTMDKFYSEHPVQMSQDTFREVMTNAKNRAPLAFISEDKINRTRHLGASEAHLQIVSRSKKAATKKASNQSQEPEGNASRSSQGARGYMGPGIQRCICQAPGPHGETTSTEDLGTQKKKRAAIIDKLLDNNEERIDVERRRREKKLRPRTGATGHAIFRRFQTANQTQIFKHDGGRRRRTSTAETKFRRKKTFNTVYADRLAREKFISKAHF